MGASFLNTGFLLSTGISVSHLTGDISRLGSGLSELGEDPGSHTLQVLLATLGFIAGATFSGALLHHPTLEIAKPYGRIILLLGVLLLVAHQVHGPHPLLAVSIASAVCGAQNALASRYRGIVLRTTHLTGIFTDFGIHLGMKMRGHRIEGWKLLIPTCITLSFLAGAIGCSALFASSRDSWILLTGSAYVGGGILWSLCKRALKVG